MITLNWTQWSNNHGHILRRSDNYVHEWPFYLSFEEIGYPAVWQAHFSTRWGTQLRTKPIQYQIRAQLRTKPILYQIRAQFRKKPIVYQIRAQLWKKPILYQIRAQLWTKPILYQIRSGMVCFLNWCFDKWNPK